MFVKSVQPRMKALVGWVAIFLALFFGLLASGCIRADQITPSTAAVNLPTQGVTTDLHGTPTSRALPTMTPTHTPIQLSTPSLVPSAAPISLDCWDAGGQFELGSQETELLRQPLEFRVFLPPCYREQPDRMYPVLYLIHGQSFTDDQWERLGAGDIAGELAAQGELPPFLIVMPRDRLWLEPANDPFGQAVVEVLLPWIEANYRVIPDRQYRAVGGLSRGGAWALHLGLTHPELFAVVGMHSGFVFQSDFPSVRIWLEAIPPQQMPRFYLDIGDNDRPDIAASAIWFEALLTDYVIPHEWHTFTGYHEEAYWQAHVAQYLRWYARDWPLGD